MTAAMTVPTMATTMQQIFNMTMMKAKTAGTTHGGFCGSCNGVIVVLIVVSFLKVMLLH